MDYQQLLLQQIRKEIGLKISINDEIAAVLNISYDAAHRRVSGKSKFSIEETVLLAKHFKISMDHLFLDSNHIIVEKTIEILTLADMLKYFQNSALFIEKITKNENSVIYYSAKDIPLFYFMDGTILSKFKAFVWINMLNSKQKQLNFEDFVINESFFEPMRKLKKVYEKTRINEVWNDTTINSSLQQISYFYEAGLLNFDSAQLLFRDLRRILDVIKNKCLDVNNTYSLFFNELILLNNNLLFKSEKKLTMFVPYTLLGYFITENEESCSNVNTFFEQQIDNSLHLNAAGIKGKNKFFDKMTRKIDFYETQIKVNVEDF